VLKALGLTKALVVDRRGNATLLKSVRNLVSAKCLAPEGLNVYDILNFPGLVIARTPSRPWRTGCWAPRRRRPAR
jgi:large subunit ribosomal protein L4